ncbi:MAG: acetyl-CoA carboxylase biotin carboxyl carrier protein [Eubacteriales bacterium]
MDQINTKELFEIMDRLEKSRFDFLEIQTHDGVKIKLGKEQKILAPSVMAQAPAAAPVHPAPAVPSPAASQPVADKAQDVIKSPLIGVFYTSASPDSAPYVTIGKSVKRGEVICIIEAMKVMNEIESDTDGEIIDILVQNGQAVEFGQPLFSVRKV